VASAVIWVVEESFGMTLLGGMTGNGKPNTRLPSWNLTY